MTWLKYEDRSKRQTDFRYLDITILFFPYFPIERDTIVSLLYMFMYKNFPSSVISLMKLLRNRDPQI